MLIAGAHGRRAVEANSFDKQNKKIPYSTLKATWMRHVREPMDFFSKVPSKIFTVGGFLGPRDRSSERIADLGFDVDMYLLQWTALDFQGLAVPDPE